MSSVCTRAGQFLRVILPTALALMLCNMDRICMSIAILPMSAEFGWAPSVQARAASGIEPAWKNFTACSRSVQKCSDAGVADFVLIPLYTLHYLVTLPVVSTLCHGKCVYMSLHIFAGRGAECIFVGLHAYSVRRRLPRRQIWRWDPATQPACASGISLRVGGLTRHAKVATLRTVLLMGSEPARRQEGHGLRHRLVLPGVAAAASRLQPCSEPLRPIVPLTLCSSPPCSLSASCPDPTTGLIRQRWGPGPLVQRCLLSPCALIAAKSSSEWLWSTARRALMARLRVGRWRQRG